MAQATAWLSRVKAANQEFSAKIDPLGMALAGGGIGAGIGGLYGLTRKPGNRNLLGHTARGALVGGGSGLGAGVGAIGGGLGGVGLGALASALANKGHISPEAVLAGGGVGAGIGGLGGGLLAGKKVHKMTAPDEPEKKADWTDEAAAATQQAVASNLKQDAMSDIGRLALATAGVGAAGRGAVGLYNMFKRSMRPKKKPSNQLSLPYPVAPEKAGSYLGDLAKGDVATTKSGIPWYGPAMMMAGLGGLGAGWKGVDHVLNKRRARERDNDLSAARQEFHDALMGQYTQPLTGTTPPSKTASDAKPMEKVGAALDVLFDHFTTVITKLDERLEKTGNLNDLAGAGLGMYGMYAGLAGLGTGALVYDKARKRQRRAVLEKAIQRRDRRKFNVAPPEITATPEPFHAEPAPV